jgi:protein SCO1/2
MFAGVALAQPSRDVRSEPGYLDGVGLDEHLGAALPGALVFSDESGRAVRLGEYLRRGQPVLLTLNYSRCPMLCSLELSGLVRGLRSVHWRPGRDFSLVTVSLDPNETRQDSARAKARYVHEYGDKASATAWHFLTGTSASVRALAASIGYRYRHDSVADQYYHPAAIMVVDAAGDVVRYLYGIDPSPETLRLALVEAAQGKMGSTVDRLILFCCAYDPKKGTYAFLATRLFRGAAGIVALLLVFFLGRLWWAEARRPTG